MDVDKPVQLHTLIIKKSKVEEKVVYTNAVDSRNDYFLKGTTSVSIGQRNLMSAEKVLF